MAERRYNEQEIAAILRAAGEAQSKGTKSAADSDGLTLTDIARIATEVGIDPAYIDVAAQNLTVPKGKKHPWGAPTHQVIERTFDGTFDDVSWEDAVAEFRLTFGTAGETSVVGTSREWAGGSDFKRAHISATPRNSKTRIRITLRQDGYIFIIWMVTFILSFLSTIFMAAFASKMHIQPLMALVAILATIATIAGTGRWRLGKANNRNVGEAEDLLDRVGKLALSTNESETVRTKIVEPQTLDQSL